MVYVSKLSVRVVGWEGKEIDLISGVCIFHFAILTIYELLVGWEKNMVICLEKTRKKV